MLARGWQRLAAKVSPEQRDAVNDVLINKQAIKQVAS